MLLPDAAGVGVGLTLPAGDRRRPRRTDVEERVSGVVHSKPRLEWPTRRRWPSTDGVATRGDIMELVAVQQEIVNWTPDEQDQLAAYLEVIRLQRTADHAEELSRRVSDRAPQSWMPLEEVKKRLRSDADPR